MKTIKAYTPAELKKKYPDAFEDALEWFRGQQDEIPWQGEIMDSFKAIFHKSGIFIRDWSISGDCPSQSYVTFGFSHNIDDEVKELTGQRALAWLEHNLFDGLRERRTFVNRVKRYEKWYDFTKYGEIPSCPFTGYCADEDFIEALLKEIKTGSTLGEAYKSLAQVAGKLFEQEIEYQNSEENFLVQDHLLFTKDGAYIQC